MDGRCGNGWVIVGMVGVEEIVIPEIARGCAKFPDDGRNFARIIKDNDAV